MVSLDLAASVLAYSSANFTNSSLVESEILTVVLLLVVLLLIVVLLFNSGVVDYLVNNGLCHLGIHVYPLGSACWLVTSFFDFRNNFG